jgi:hypothetical protein
MATVVKAPNPYNTNLQYSIFMAGAIDMGQARAWSSEVVEALSDIDVLLLDPRRDDWSDDWEQCETCEPFATQVNWELDSLDACDMCIFVFTADSKAPITFLELGLFGAGKPAMICAEKGFYRTGNLQIVARRFNIPIYDNLDDMLTDLRETLKEKA